MNRVPMFQVMLAMVNFRSIGFSTGKTRIPAVDVPLAPVRRDVY